MNPSRAITGIVLTVTIVFGLFMTGLFTEVVRGEFPFEGTTFISSPSEFSQEEIDEIRTKIENYPSLESLLIHHRGERVMSHYSGVSRGEAVNMKSASKSILSALVGIAIKNGDLDGLDQRIHDFFPKMVKNAPVEKQNMTLRDLLLMRSGLESTSFGHYGRWVTSNHWLKYALTRPLVNTPGAVTKYSTGNSHIVAAVLTEATGQDLRRYAQKHLFDPIGVEIKGWQKSPEGYRFGGNNLFLSPEGLLRFGRLYLNDGRWNGRQVIPSHWVKQSTRRIVFDTHNGYPYGFFWWNTRYHGLDVNFAWGHGGQYVFVVPERDLVVATTSNLQSTTHTDNYTEKIHRLLEKTILDNVTAN